MQLTKQQRIFIVLRFNETRSYVQVRQDFGEQFPERNSPSKTAILKTVRKFKDKGTVLNLNKGNSGSKITQRTPKKIEHVRRIFEESPHCSIRRNGSGLPRSTFNKIAREDLGYYPYKIQIKH